MLPEAFLQRMKAQLGPEYEAFLNSLERPRAVALRFNVPAAAMKLVSAIIVAVAISMPAIREHFAFEKRRHAARARRTVTNREGQ